MACSQSLREFETTGVPAKTTFESSTDNTDVVSYCLMKNLLDSRLQ